MVFVVLLFLLRCLRFESQGFEGLRGAWGSDFRVSGLAPLVSCVLGNLPGIRAQREC